MHPDTHNNARWITYKYFNWLASQGHINLYNVEANQIQKFLIHCSEEMTQNSMCDVALHLRKLYAFLFNTGLSVSAYKALLSFSVNRESKIFPALPKSDIAKMLDVIDRNTVLGKRAYAAMLLGTVLGLRACDVVALKLTDIDWVSGKITLVQSKTGKTVALPLTTDVGEALSDYILNARPKTDSLQVFMRLNAPFTPIMSAVTIGEIYSYCCRKAGLPDFRKFHNLRRSLGTSLVNTGTPAPDTAQILGDTDVNSIKPYIAADNEHLKLCALSFEGISPVGGIKL